MEYAVELTTATREPGEENWVEFGASPRGSINLVHAGRALALLRGRDYVLPSDIRDVARDVLRHRLVLTYEALAAGVDADRVLDDVLEDVRMPHIELSDHERRDARRGSGSGADVSFREPLLLLALALLPLAIAAYVLAQRRRKKFALRYTNVDVLAAVAGRSWGRHVPAAFALLALAALLVGLGRPERTVAAPQRQGAVIMVTDTSGSMEATDVAPTAWPPRRARRGRWPRSSRRSSISGWSRSTTSPSSSWPRPPTATRSTPRSTR